MRLLLTNHELAQRTGTELAVCELAVGLRKAGHEVAVFAWRIGPVGRALAEAGVPVVESPEDAPFEPDVIHGQHHLATMAALAAWPGVPGLYYCHGVLPFDEHPPRHPRLLRFLSMAERNVEWIRETTGAPPDAVHTLPNWVDVRRFADVRTPGARPVRAAWFANRLRPGPETESVAAACSRSGLTLDLIGAGFGTATDEPERVLPGFDVVFATGRSALEALACGCAVVSCEPERVGPMITPENLDHMTTLNFCVDGGHPKPSVDTVMAALGPWNPDQAAVVTARVRAERSLEVAIRTLAAHYDEVRTRFREGGIAAGSEAVAWVEYLRFLRDRTHNCDDAFAAARREARQAVARSERAEARLDRAKRSHREIVDRLRGSWWGRRWLRRLGEGDSWDR